MQVARCANSLAIRLSAAAIGLEQGDPIGGFVCHGLCFAFSAVRHKSPHLRMILSRSSAPGSSLSA
jgi:hypothetical protein